MAWCQIAALISLCLLGVIHPKAKFCEFCGDQVAWEAGGGAAHVKAARKSQNLS